MHILRIGACCSQAIPQQLSHDTNICMCTTLNCACACTHARTHTHTHTHTRLYSHRPDCNSCDEACGTGAVGLRGRPGGGGGGGGMMQMPLTARVFDFAGWALKAPSLARGRCQIMASSSSLPSTAGMIDLLQLVQQLKVCCIRPVPDRRPVFLPSRPMAGRRAPYA